MSDLGINMYLELKTLMYCVFKLVYNRDPSVFKDWAIWYSNCAPTNKCETNLFCPARIEWLFKF